MDQTKRAAYKTLAHTIIKKLELRNMTGHWCETSADVLDLVRELVPSGSTVTWGGSVTLDEAGVRDALRAGDYRVLDRSTAQSEREQRQMWLDRTGADWFFMSSNAVTRDGELVNIDGNSDRLSLLLHGPAHVMVVVGMNKVVADVDAGVKRIRTTTCPPNAARIHTQTPCEFTGVCADCHSPKCMCCQTVVTRHSRHAGRIHVVLVGEDLGY